MKPLKYLSASQLELYEKDYSAWHAHYVLGQPTPTSRYMTQGSAVHAGIEAYWKGATSPADAYLAYIEEHCLEIPAENLGEIRDEGTSLLTCYLTVLAPDLSCWPVEPPNHAAEWEFCVPIPGCVRPLYGKVDLLAQEDGQPVIRDVKCAKRPWSKNKVAKSIQKVAYWWAVQQSLGLSPLRFVLDFVVKESMEIVSIDATVEQHEIDDLLGRFQKLDQEYLAYEKGGA